MGHFENSRDDSNRDERREGRREVKRQARSVKNWKARAKHYYKGGGLSAATRVVSVIVCVQQSIYVLIDLCC